MVDIVVVTYRSERVLDDCLRAAEGVARSNVIVVDHGDGSCAAIARGRGHQAIIDSSNPGFGAGQNRGVALGSAPYVLMLNPDALVDGPAVSAGVDYLDRRPGVAAVQGVIRGAGGQPERSQGNEVRPVHLVGRALGARALLRFNPVRRLGRRTRVLHDHVERVPAQPAAVESLAATALLVRRSAFEMVGRFDPAYFLYGEDLDLCHRFRKAGWELYALPVEWATHSNAGSSASLAARELAWWRGTMQFAARWYSGLQWYVALTAGVLRWLTYVPAHGSRAGEAWRSFVSGPRRDRAHRGHRTGRAHVSSVR